MSAHAFMEPRGKTGKYHSRGPPKLRQKIVTFQAMTGSHVNYKLKGVFIAGIKSEQY